MFSRLVQRSAALGVVVRKTAQGRALAVLPRCASTDGGSEIQKQIDQWDKANQLYYGPERDLKNFPITRQPETAPPTRLGLIPESWFTALYDKMGVTGPYTLGVGSIVYLLSKEIWVVDHYFPEVLGFTLMFVYVSKKFGPKIGSFLDEQAATHYEAKFVAPIDKAKAGSLESIAAAEKSIWREEGQKHVFEAKRENVGLQLEAIYRERMMDVYQKVKQRLDYQLSLENTKRSFEQKHMVKWIVDSVVKGITPQQEKDAMSKCIADLKALSLTAKASV